MRRHSPGRDLDARGGKVDDSQTTPGDEDEAMAEDFPGSGGEPGARQPDQAEG